MQHYQNWTVVIKHKMEHKPMRNAASPKCFMAHGGIQHKSGANGRCKRFKRIKITLLKSDVTDKTDFSCRHVVKVLFINTILFMEYL